jgi:hypothetical protein
MTTASETRRVTRLLPTGSRELVLRVSFVSLALCENVNSHTEQVGKVGLPPLDSLSSENQNPGGQATLPDLFELNVRV